ncbi:MAG: SDR family oxidoreductase [Kiritimatiellia bacterium]|nr:SDR family oxidoreductase [Kiritimatiellia bacterium]MDP6809739.1 SDR family oxidoreductase [Kiritimatiellia bacterium]MDP7025151.1 SDR family oxidoreductase [Kiritimatiellia bacterium]
MDTRRILVTGASGFLGWNLLREPWADWEWIGSSYRHDPELGGPDVVRTDLTVPGAIATLLDDTRPDVVLHAAAVTDLNVCERDPDGTVQINVETPATLAALCARQGIRFVFTSSDMVFDGRNPPYDETSQPCPVNIYGLQKAEAEARVLAANPEAAICRMPLMFGAAGPWAHNFLPEWIETLTHGRPLMLFTDEYRAPVSATVAQSGLRIAVEQQVSGILHLGGEERLSRYDFGKLLCEVWGLDSALLQAVRRADVDGMAPRPGDTFLDNHRAKGLGYRAPSLQEQLTGLKAEGRVA